LLHDGTYTTFNDPLATGGTFGFGINAAGDIVGTYIDRAGVNHGFLLHHGRYTIINVP
jgi:hypothetical protein